MHKKTIKLLVIIGSIGLLSLVINLVFNVSICLFYDFTGIPCPACGMTRAYMSMLSLDIRGAFHNHPLFLLVPFIILLAGYTPSPEKEKIWNRLWIVVTILFLVTWVARLVVLFPYTPPMEFNKEAILPKIWFALQ